MLAFAFLAGIGMMLGTFLVVFEISRGEQEKQNALRSVSRLHDHRQCHVLEQFVHDFMPAMPDCLTSA
jgi:hypothetical protein